MNKSMFTSDSEHWCTPKNVLDRVREVGTILLDPCSNENSIVNSKVAYTKLDNGLAQEWPADDGLVFVNPPYGRSIKNWTQKMLSESQCGVEIVALLPARPDTAWWQDHVATADAICFWRGRLTFLGAPAPAPFPSALVYWGNRMYRFADVFSDVGWIIVQ